MSKNQISMVLMLVEFGLGSIVGGFAKRDCTSLYVMTAIVVSLERHTLRELPLLLIASIWSDGVLVVTTVEH